MSVNMYDILKEAARQMKERGVGTVKCNCPVHGDFVVYAL